MKKQHKNVIAGATKQSHKLKLHLNRLLRHSFGIPRNDGIKKILLLLAILFSINSFSQKVNFKTYTHAQLFKMIAAETDSVFKLNDAIIVFNKTTDSLFSYTIDNINQANHFIRTDTIIINKTIELNNVHFEHENKYDNFQANLNHIKFIKPVTFINTSNFVFRHCVFNEKSIFKSDEKSAEGLDWLTTNTDTFNEGIFGFNSTFLKGIDIDINPLDIPLKNQIYFDNCDFWTTDDYRSVQFWARNIFAASIDNSRFHNSGIVSITSMENSMFILDKNDFGKIIPDIRVSKPNGFKFLRISENKFDSYILLNIDEFDSNYTIPWNQFQSKLISDNAYTNYIVDLYEKSKKKISYWGFRDNDSILKDYVVNKRYIAVKESYKNEIQFLAKFHDLYKAQHDTEDSNAVYMTLKDMETERLEYLYKESPSFKTYFKWKVNQFLKAFSDYGTEPSKAIVVSVYVILLFAFIYLLFPNSWDSHGKKRLMSRFEFFQKYLRRKEGMHTIYLEGKKEEISSYEDFKANLENTKTELPSFFITWSKPLYNASMFSSRITSRFLQKTDILKGKWKDLTPKQKRWKNIQIGFLLTLGLVYDLFIKALNALMLSINTFTTLGFGEIPIKGLPRYLAIIQGFIGWFMLTIFSVSLISQLLN